jgi:hypothetical protein
MLIDGRTAMFLNFSNHPSDKWSREQVAAATAYGEIVDMPFPEVDADGDEGYVQRLAVEYAAKIRECKPAAVLCQGEMTLAFAVAAMLAESEVAVLAACSKREVVEETDEDGATVKRAQFRFTRFRRYLVTAS